MNDDFQPGRAENVSGLVETDFDAVRRLDGFAVGRWLELSEHGLRIIERAQTKTGVISASAKAIRECLQDKEREGKA
jgi:hypothetical protein